MTTVAESLHCSSSISFTRFSSTSAKMMKQWGKAAADLSQQINKQQSTDRQFDVGSAGVSHRRR